MHRIILFLISTLSSIPLIHAASSSNAPDNNFEPKIPSLQNLAMHVLADHPDLIARDYALIGDANLQSTLFIESVHRALRTRYGVKALKVKPPIPLIKRVLRNEMHPLFSPDGTILATDKWHPVTAGYYTTCLRNAATSELIGSFDEGAHRPVFSPDSKLIALTSFFRGVRTEHEIHLRNAKTGKLICSFEGDKPIFSPDSTIIASRTKSYSTGLYEIELRNTATGAFVYRFEESEHPVFSPDGSIIAFTARNGVTRDHEIRMHDTATHMLLSTFEAEIHPTFSPDGTVLASQFRKNMGFHYTNVRLRHIETGQVIQTIEGEAFDTFSPDGKTLITHVVRTDSIANDIQLRNSATGQLIQAINKDHNPIFSPDSTVFAAWTWNYNVARHETHLRNAKTGVQISTLEGIECRAFSPDSTIFALSTMNHTAFHYEIRLYDTAMWHLIGIIEDEQDATFSPDNAMLVSDSGEGTVLREADFRPAIGTIANSDERIVLLFAAHRWLQKKSYRIDLHDPAYQTIISRVPFLNNPILFDTQTKAESKIPRASFVRISSSSHADAGAPGKSGVRNGNIRSFRKHQKTSNASCSIL